MRRAVGSLHGRGLSGTSIARMLSSWRGLFNWLARHHGFGVNPAAGVRAPKSPKRLPNALSPELTARLLDAHFIVNREEGGQFLLRGENMIADPTRPLLGKPTPCVGRPTERRLIGSRK